MDFAAAVGTVGHKSHDPCFHKKYICLLYTSDAADE